MTSLYKTLVQEIRPDDRFNISEYHAEIIVDMIIRRISGRIDEMQDKFTDEHGINEQWVIGCIEIFEDINEMLNQ